MPDVTLQIVDATSGATVFNSALTLGTPQQLTLNVGNYIFIATYLATGEVKTSNVTIAKGVNIELDFTFTPATNETMTLGTTLIDYGSRALTAAQISYIVANFKMCVFDCWGMSQATVTELRVAAPNMLIYAYRDMQIEWDHYPDWSIVNANESWFLHDSNGKRVYAGTYTSSDGVLHYAYLMDISSGWKQHWASYMSNLVNGTDYTGVYMDDVWNDFAGVQTYMPIYEYGTGIQLQTAPGTPPNAPYIDPSYPNNWRNNVISMLQTAQAAMNTTSHNKHLIINVTAYNDNTFINQVTGAMWEGFFYGQWYQTWNTSDQIIASINYMIAASPGKILLIESSYPMPTGYSPDNPPPNSGIIAQVANYCYAASLLGMNTVNVYFGFCLGAAYDYSTGTQFMPPIVTDLGSPTGAYYSSQNVYVRNFQNGIALLNPSSSPYTVNLGANYQAQDGTIVSSLTLAAYSGAVLLTPSTPPLPNYNLSLNSNIAATIKIDNIPYTTPQTISLKAGSHTIQAITPITIVKQQYAFTNWQDGTTNPTQTLNLTADGSITATYKATSTPQTLKKALVGLGLLGIVSIGALVVSKKKKE